MSAKSKGLLLGCCLGLLCLAVPAKAQSLKLDGRWWTPLGVLKITQAGKKISGTLAWKCAICPFKGGEEVLKGVLLEDSLSGQVRFCLKGKECKGDGWAPMVLLVAREGKVLSGAAHFSQSSCSIGGKGKGDGVMMRKVRPQPKKPVVPPAAPDAGFPVAAADGGSQAAPDGGTSVASADEGKPPVPNPEPGEAPVDDKGHPLQAEVQPLDPKAYEKNHDSWRAAMDEAKGQMDNGFFERARKKFLEATELDPTRPEAFNGIGVTYYGRGDYEEALNWYKKALEVNPNFGDAFYNMACIYSLMKKNEMAFRYLHIAALDGFVQPDVMQQDPDLNNVRSDPMYQEILKEMSEGGAKKPAK